METQIIFLKQILKPNYQKIMIQWFYLKMKIFKQIHFNCSVIFKQIIFLCKIKISRVQNLKFKKIVCRISWCLKFEISLPLILLTLKEMFYLYIKRKKIKRIWLLYKFFKLNQFKPAYFLKNLKMWNKRNKKILKRSLLNLKKIELNWREKI